MNKFFPFYIALFLFQLSTAQELTVTYYDKFVYPSNAKIKNEYFAKLLISGGKSIYYPEDEIKDSKNTMVINASELEKEVTEKIVHKYSTINFKNKEENIQVTNIKQGGKNYLISEDFKEISTWNITNEKKKIGDYQCTLATSESKGVKIEAWFTDEIPISNGPAEFGGLPGLILELKKGIKHIVAKKIAFNCQVNLIKIPTQGKKMSRESYDDMINNLMGITEKDITKTNVESIGGGTKTTTTRTIITRTNYNNQKDD